MFRAATRIYPESWNSWDSLGECFLKLERFDEARRSYERSVELNPDNANGCEALERLARRDDS